MKCPCLGRQENNNLVLSAVNMNFVPENCTILCTVCSPCVCKLLTVECLSINVSSQTQLIIVHVSWI